MSKTTYEIDLSGFFDGLLLAFSFLWLLIWIAVIGGMWNTDVNLLPPDVPPNPTWAYILAAIKNAHSEKDESYK